MVAGAAVSRHPALSSYKVVFARCAEVVPLGSLEQLSRHGIDWVVYQKAPCNTSSATRSSNHLAQLSRLGRVVSMAHNRGDECSAYLQYIVDSYDALHDVTAFLQFGSERQQIMASVLATVNATATRRNL